MIHEDVTPLSWTSNWAVSPLMSSQRVSCKLSRVKQGN